MSANSVVIGQYQQDVLLCGVRSWGAYEKKDGKMATPGCVIIVRRDDVDRQTGEKVHNVEEVRVPVEYRHEVEALGFGAPLKLSFETHKSTRIGSDRAWSECVGIDVPQPAK